MACRLAGLLAGDRGACEPFELVDAPPSGVVAGEVQDEGSPPVVGLAGGDGRGDLAGQVPVEVDAAHVGGEDRLTGPDASVDGLFAVAAVLGRGEEPFEVFWRA